MRFLHTSDWHLGRQFYNVSLLEDQEHILDQVIGVVRERQVEAVIVSGDVYDRSVPPAAAVELLDSAVNRICKELQVPMIIVAGNHDGPERLGFGARQLAGAGLHVVGPLWRRPEPVILRGKGAEVAFYPIPYADPYTVRNAFGVEVASHDAAMAYLLEQVRQDNGPERPCVVIAHCFLAGGEISESERPLCIGGADQVSPEHFNDFNYVALGHLHGCQHRGSQQIRYAGSPLKYSFSEERHCKSVTLVDIGTSGRASVELIPLQPLRNMRTVEGAFDQLMAAAPDDPGRNDYLLFRLTDAHAILDPMSKLRTLYPNALHLERSWGMVRGERLEANRERLKRGELAMFEDFYRQVTGAAMNEEQTRFVARTLETLDRDGGER